MSDAEIGVILRALGTLEGKVDDVKETLAEQARKNDARDMTLSQFDRRIYSLEQSRASQKEAYAARRRSWQDWATILGGWVLAAAEIIAKVFHVKGAP